ncbi:hypothetical protein EOL70_13380 [Leucothrix sargassi]|nr:hypothetical protein EOL70_13380 [Leucothrix sargassi]
MYKNKGMIAGICRTTALLLVALMFGLGATACSSDTVSFATQEQARMQVNENAEYNATNWRNENAPKHKILMRGDSTIGEKCARGDGWVTVDLKNPTHKADVITLKCSSVSGSIGCLVLEDFQERKEYFKQDGQCNHKLPFPLPKIQL